jgi:hypothetical protein
MHKIAITHLATGIHANIVSQSPTDTATLFHWKAPDDYAIILPEAGFIRHKEDGKTVWNGELKDKNIVDLGFEPWPNAANIFANPWGDIDLPFYTISTLNLGNGSVYAGFTTQYPDWDIATHIPMDAPTNYEVVLTEAGFARREGNGTTIWEMEGSGFNPFDLGFEAWLDVDFED